YLVNMGEHPSNGKLKLILAGMRKKIGFEITAAVTNSYPGIDGLYQAYIQVQQLYHLANEEEVSLLEESSGLDMGRNRRYPTEIENRIISGIRKCDKEQVKQGCIDFVGQLSEDEEMNKIFLHQLAVHAQLLLNDFYDPEEVRNGFQEYYQMVFRYPAVRLVHILYELFLLVVDKRLQKVPEGDKEIYVSYVKDACLYMEEHMKDEELSIVQVAEYVFLNPVYFGRVFKAVKEMSFRQYLLQIRMEKAKQLLVSTTMTVTEICQEVGIPNGSYFAKLFKQYTGQSPTEYKK
ncbi:MAG: helix-turn-helix transcriptional regulator, partial [Eubacterium sp.]|nr:helix-turn-helix transcriptional regulator [Eubacterium sp.]